MAYPFGQSPAVRVLVQKMEGLGVKVTALPGGLVGPRGPTEIRYLEFERDGMKTWTEPLPEDEEQKCGWDLVRRLCRQLKINPADLNIGLDLG
ncbi:MAG: hypothetical protein ABJC13_03355 [Acidobacteriota bacterium]